MAKKDDGFPWWMVLPAVFIIFASQRHHNNDTYHYSSYTVPASQSKPNKPFTSEDARLQIKKRDDSVTKSFNDQRAVLNAEEEKKNNLAREKEKRAFDALAKIATESKVQSEVSGLIALMRQKLAFDSLSSEWKSTAPKGTLSLHKYQTFMHLRLMHDGIPIDDMEADGFHQAPVGCPVKDGVYYKDFEKGTVQEQTQMLVTYYQAIQYWKGVLAKK